MHPLLSEALQEAYASANTQRSAVETLEVRIGDPAFGGLALYLCTGFKSILFNLGADGWQTFQPMPFKFNLPSQDSTGAQGLSVSLENVDGSVIAFMQNALATDRLVIVKYRVFFEDDPNVSQTPRPLVLSVSGGKATSKGVVLSATVADFVNWTFPNGFYSYTSYPGLRG